MEKLIYRKTFEESFGISDDMKNQKNVKFSKRIYKWNSQTTQKDPKRKKRAKEMVKAIATLRKKYNC